MIFYRVETPTGSKLVRNKSEATAIDRNYTPFELPSDKEGQRELLNGLLQEISDLKRGIVAETPLEPVVAPVAVSSDVSLRNLDVVDEIMVRTGVEHVLWSLDREAIKRLEPIFRERLSEVTSG